VVANSLVLPPVAPDVFSRSAQVWALVDDDRDAWEDDRHLLVSVTLWYPGCRTAHLAHWCCQSNDHLSLADAGMPKWTWA